MTVIDVTAYDIREYATSLGWTLVKEALVDGLFVLNSPINDYTQLIFPKDETIKEYQEMARISIERLSQFYSKPFHIITEDIREVHDDVISLRYYSTDKIVNSLSFQEVIESIEATKQMILAAGSSVINPALYHKRLTRVEAVDLLKKTRFRHTEEGSFTLKISCPIQLESLPTPNLFGNEHNISKPISRKAFELINQSAFKMVSTVEEDNLEQFFEEQKNTEKPFISYNFCDSLVNLFDDERELPFELKFNWSKAYLNKIPSPQLPHIIKFPYSFKPKLDELKNYFKPESKETADTFFGTVESLNGNEEGNGKRSGEVVLGIILDKEIVNAKVNLNSTDYEIAYKAHGQNGGLVKIKARLLPGKRIRILDEVSSFESVSK